MTISSWKNRISLVIVAVALWFIAQKVTGDLPNFRQTLLSYSWQACAKCCAWMCAAIFLESVVWHKALVEHTQMPIPFGQNLRIFCISNLSKYIPGKVWPLVLQTSMLSLRKVTLRAIATVSLRLTAYAALAALGVGSVCVLGLPVPMGVKVL